MSNLIITGLSSAYLVSIGVLMKASGGWFAQFAFKVFPVCLGVFLAFNVYARYMGWPI